MSNLRRWNSESREADIDCGGPCSACPSCNDEIQNQGEDEVDCGGPCDDCQTTEGKEI